METKALLAKIKEQKALAELPTAGVPRKNLDGFVMVKRAAEEELLKLRAEYSTYVKASVVLMVPVLKDPAALKRQLAEFVEASMGGGSIPVNARDLYERLGQKADVPISPVTRSFSITSQTHLMDAMQEIMAELGIRSMPMPNFTADLTVPKLEDTIEASRGMVRSSLGDDLNALYLEKEIVTQCLERSVAHAVIPVLLLNTSADERESLALKIFTGRHLMIDLPEEVSTDFLKSVAKSVRNLTK